MTRMISGIKPSGKLHLGNYIGAIKPFVKYQEDHDLFVFVADLHALTLYQNPTEFYQNIDDMLAVYIAAGLEPTKCKIFRQSDIPAHSQLGWVLNCISNMSELSRMTQYKAKVDLLKEKESIGTGIFTYPNLMAADILLYDADKVPTGIDQKQHVELTKILAERFNRTYGETFKIPEPVIPKVGAKIMSLSDPTKKMSKSESDKGTIYLFDDEATIRNKIKKAVTDAESKIYFDPENKPGISNLLTIMSSLSGKSINELEEYYKNEKDYGKFKTDVADIVVAEITHIQEEIKLVKEFNIIEQMLDYNTAIVNEIAENKLDIIYKKIGLRSDI